MVKVIYAEESLIPSFYECLDSVGREKIHIEMIEAPPYEDIYKFQMSLIKKNGPLFYAVKDGTVVGWCDIFPEKNPRLCHRGNLGMGLLPEFRGQGLGSQLLESTLHGAKEWGLEKVELSVYTDNKANETR